MTRRQTRRALVLLASAVVFGSVATGCGSSDAADDQSPSSGSGSTENALTFPASAETTAALGVTRWSVSPAPDQTVFVGGFDKGGALRALFGATFENDASGEPNILSVSSLLWKSGGVQKESIRLQAQADQVVILSNGYAKDPESARAMKLVYSDLNSGLRTSGGAPAGALGTSSVHPLDTLVRDPNHPVMCDNQGNSCVTEAKDVWDSAIGTVECIFADCSPIDHMRQGSRAANKMDQCHFCYGTEKCVSSCGKDDQACQHHCVYGDQLVNPSD
jgi:hypothetical protein